MIDGRQTLTELDQAGASLGQELNTSNAALQQATEDLAKNAQEQTKTYIELARIRLDELINTDTLDSLEHLQDRISSLLASRDQSRQDIGHRINEVSQELGIINAQRQTKLDEIEDYISKISDLEAILNQNLLKNAGYQKQLEEGERLQKQAESALEKVHFAKVDYRQKAQAYENEKLFMYLWQRNYGTSKYEANKLVRYLDGWVANLCDYDQARINYWNLLEIPNRLEKHANQLRTTAAESVEKLEAIEIEARREAGIIALDDQLAAAERAKNDIDEQIDAIRKKLSGLEQEQIAFASGDDTAMKKCLQLIADTLARKDINHLREMSLATATQEDDRLVFILEELKDDQDETEDYIRTLKHARAATLKQLNELEDVKRSFKKRHFDDSRSRFANEKLIKVALNGLIEGIITGAEVWSTIERNRRQSYDYYGDQGNKGSKSRYSSRDPFKHNKHRPRFKRYSSSKSEHGFRTGGGF